MQKRFSLLILIVVTSSIYGTFCIYSMLYNNRTPCLLECLGVRLSPQKVIAISNYKRKSNDTLFVNFEQSKVIMPSTLGYLYFDKTKNEYILKNNACIFNPTTTRPANYFLPFCRTLNDGKFSSGKYFGALETISQNTLTGNGIKYNSSVGTPENRVSVELIKFKNQYFLKTKDDGIGTKYLVKSNYKNLYDICLNTTSSKCPNAFSFDNTTSTIANYTLKVQANTFKAYYEVKDNTGTTIDKGNGSNSVFIIDGFLFIITPKFTGLFSILYLLFYCCIIAFQFYFLKLYTYTDSPVIQSLFSIRILLNCIVFLATPLFLTSYYLVSGRSYYLLLVILLNFSFFTSKRVLHNVDFNKHKGLLFKLIWLVVILAPAFIYKYTQNESLFGVIPVLHVQKVIILMMIFVTQDNFLNFLKNNYWLRIIIIAAYAFLVSVLTSDIGSFIYTALAFLLVELVRKTIKLKTVIICCICVVSFLFISYRVAPDKFSDRKAYRILAPYTSPESAKLALTNQADRESYSTLFLNLKNIVNVKTPQFNNLVIPSNMRSTCHSDFAFHWSITMGGIIFFLLFMTAVLFLISNLILLLFCSIRECKINEKLSFAFPLTKEAELVRFLLAFTIISFIYPVISNTLIIPLTGQSIPCLSISNIEVIFLIFLLVSLESIFTNEKYINSNSNTKYQYADAKISINYSLFVVISILILAFLFRAFLLGYTDNSLVWKKHISDERIKLNTQIPDSKDKIGLVNYGKTIIGNDELTSIDKKKKSLLKDLASLYYSNIPYTQTIYESKVFENSTKKLLNQMTIDSIFNNKSKLISGVHHPFGNVYAFNQKVNNKQVINVTNDFYRCIPIDAQSINTDLTAECNRLLVSHLLLIGLPNNIGSITIVKNKSGSIVANSSYPLISDINSNEIYYLIGSIKKLLIAYVALKIDASFQNKIYGGKTFKEFLQYSDDYYSACLLKDLLKDHKQKLNEILTLDFDLPLFSLTDDSYLDTMPTFNDFKKELNRNNTIYRQAIGQQKPYKFIEVMKWYSRVASGLKIELNYMNENKSYETQSMNSKERKYLINILNSVMYGTASKVRIALENNKIRTDKMICKTGTTEKSDRLGNSASSFILSNDIYTVGVMLKGNIPNNAKNLSAKDLFVSLIPVLKKYNIIY